MNWMGILTIIGTIFGVVSTFIAVRERSAAKRAMESEAKVKALYEEKCENRCKDLVDQVKGLYENAISSCKFIEENSPKLIKSVGDDENAIQSITFLIGNIRAIAAQAGSLKSLCRRFNDEHRNEFGKPVFENIDECIIGDVCLPYKGPSNHLNSRNSG